MSPRKTIDSGGNIPTQGTPTSFVAPHPCLLQDTTRRLPAVRCSSDSLRSNPANENAPPGHKALQTPQSVHRLNSRLILPEQVPNACDLHPATQRSQEYPRNRFRRHRFSSHVIRGVCTALLAKLVIITFGCIPSRHHRPGKVVISAIAKK